MGIFQSVVEGNPEMNFIGNWRGRFEMAVPASFLFHDSNLSLFSPQILPYKIICRLLDLNKKIHKFNLFSFFLFLWSSWFLVRFRGICTRYCLTGSVIWIVLIGAGLFTMQKKTTTQHNTQNKKTKQRKREKDQIFILMRSFLSKKDIPVFYELTSIHRNGFVYFEKWSIFNFSS